MRPQPLRPGDVRSGFVGDAVAAVFEEAGVRVVGEGDVQPVDPSHRLIGLVVVAVEVPAGCQQEVAAAQGHRVTVDDGPHALALDDEAKGVLAVAVFGRGLARPEVLDGRPQGRRHVRCAAQSGVGQRDGAAFPAPADGHQVTGALGQRVQRRPLPHERHRTGCRAQRHQFVELRPQRRQVLGVEIRVQPGQFPLVGGLLRLGHRSAPVRCACRRR